MGDDYQLPKLQYRYSHKSSFHHRHLNHQDNLHFVAGDTNDYDDDDVKKESDYDDNYNVNKLNNNNHNSSWMEMQETMKSNVIKNHFSHNRHDYIWSSDQGWVSDQRQGQRRRRGLTNQRIASMEDLNNTDRDTTTNTIMIGQYRIHNSASHSAASSRSQNQKFRLQNYITKKKYHILHFPWFQFFKEHNYSYISSVTTGTFSLVSVVVVTVLFFFSPNFKQKYIFGNYHHKHDQEGNWQELIEKDIRYYTNHENEIRRVLQSSLSQFDKRTWPFSIQDEVMDFDLIHHPYYAHSDKVINDTGGSTNKAADDTDTMLAVPQFYIQNYAGNDSSTILGSDGKLLTRRLANSIGIHHNYNEFDKVSSSSNDPNTRTIFVGITSYRDWRCRHTIESILSRAKHPERIRIGIVDQLDVKTDKPCDNAPVQCHIDPEQILCKYSNRIDHFELDAKHAVGSPFARHIMNRMYRGEYYSLQINAQVEFVQDWDQSIIDQHDATGNEMAVISTYLQNSYDNMSSESGMAINLAQYVICNISYEGVRGNRLLKHKRKDQPLAISQIQGSPYLHPFWSSSFSFARGHFILNIPYDPYLIMTSTEDEEISMGLRAWTHGYDFYVPEKSVCFLSFEEETVIDGGVTEHTHSYLEHFEQDFYLKQNKKSLKRLYEIIGMGSNVKSNVWNYLETVKYGLGHVRNTKDYFSSFGIHVLERITERKLCDFITSGMMHRDFSEYIREDGMGIDYSKIHFRFHELLRIHDG